MVEFRSNLRSEKPASTTRRNSPGVNVVGVRPHEVTVSSFVRDLLSALNKADLVKSLDIRRKTSMDAEDLAFDYGSCAK